MKAVVIQDPENILRQHARFEIKNQDDIILKVTSTAICGSDLHMYSVDYHRSSFLKILLMNRDYFY